MQEKSQSNSKPAELIAKFLVSFGGYFDGELYRFVKQNNKLILEESKNEPKILFVGSNQLHEKVLSFPIDDRKEIDKLLKLQLGNNEIGVIQNIEEGKSQINTWSFNKAVPKSFIRLPESLVLSSACENGEVILLEGNNQSVTYLTRFDNVIYSATSHGMVNTSDRFAMSVGLSLGHPTSIEVSDRANAIVEGIRHLRIKQIFPFMIKSVKIEPKRLFLNIAIPVIALMSVYLFLTSGYLIFKNSIAEKQLADKKSSISEIFSTQSSIDDHHVIYTKLSEFRNSKNNIAGVWVAVAPLFDKAKLTNITLEENKVFVRGSTLKASELLESLSRDSNVLNAKFETPVRKSKDIEKFNLSFILNSKLVLSDSKRKP